MRTSDVRSTAFHRLARSKALPNAQPCLNCVERVIRQFHRETECRLAMSILPTLRAPAPVKAPFSWPKSSSVFDEALGDTAAQLRARRRLARVCSIDDEPRAANTFCRFRPRRAATPSWSRDALICLLTSRIEACFADDARESVTRGILFAEQQIFAKEFLRLRGAFHEQFQMVEIDRLLMNTKALSFMAETASSTEP